MNTHLFLAYCLAVAILVLMPGPVVTLVVANSLRHGSRSGLATVAGASLGNAILLIATAVGLIAFFALLSRGPARIAQLRASDVRVGLSAHGGEVAVGEDANLVVFDPGVEWTVDRDRLQSRATNTPYHGRTLRGRARATIARGRLIAENGEMC